MKINSRHAGGQPLKGNVEGQRVARRRQCHLTLSRPLPRASAGLCGGEIDMEGGLGQGQAGHQAKKAEELFHTLLLVTNSDAHQPGSPPPELAWSPFRTRMKSEIHGSGRDLTNALPKSARTQGQRTL